VSASSAYHSAAMRVSIGLPAVLLCLAAACSSGSPSFTLTTASVDPTYFCPGGSKDAPYDLHATIGAHNGTNSPVTIQAVTAAMTLAAVKGDWLEKAGSRYDAGSVHFAPATVAAGSTATLKVTIPSACTSDRYGGSGSSYGDYQVTMHVTTSAGAFTIAAANQHEIIAA
jgi:hypothetical protein